MARARGVIVILLLLFLSPYDTDTAPYDTDTTPPPASTPCPAPSPELRAFHSPSPSPVPPPVPPPPYIEPYHFPYLWLIFPALLAFIAVSIPLSLLGAKYKLMHRMKCRFRSTVRRTVRRNRAATFLDGDRRLAAFEKGVEEARQLFADAVEDVVRHCMSCQLVPSSASVILLELAADNQIFVSKTGAVTEVASLLAHISQADPEYQTLIGKSFNTMQLSIDAMEKASQYGTLFGKLYKAKAFGIEVLRSCHVSSSTTNVQMEYLVSFFVELESLYPTGKEMSLLTRLFLHTEDDTWKVVVENMGEFFYGPKEENAEKWLLFDELYSKRRPSINKAMWAISCLLSLALKESTVDGCVRSINNTFF